MSVRNYPHVFARFKYCTPIPYSKKGPGHGTIYVRPTTIQQIDRFSLHKLTRPNSIHRKVDEHGIRNRGPQTNLLSRKWQFRFPIIFIFSHLSWPFTVHHFGWHWQSHCCCHCLYFIRKWCRGECVRVARNQQATNTKLSFAEKCARNHFILCAKASHSSPLEMNRSGFLLANGCCTSPHCFLCRGPVDVDRLRGKSGHGK